MRFAANQLDWDGRAAQEEYLRQIIGTPSAAPSPGALVYQMACLPCHQPEGKGLPGVYPPLAESEWVRDDSERLVKILLYGLSGKITVAGQEFGGPDATPMPSLGGLSDEQIADVPTFVRKNFGADASAVSVDQVKKVRSATAHQERPWTVEELTIRRRRAWLRSQGPKQK